MLVINSGGKNVCCGVEKPAEPIIVEIVPWMILNRASINSSAAPDAHDGAALLPPRTPGDHIADVCIVPCIL